MRVLPGGFIKQDEIDAGVQIQVGEEVVTDRRLDLRAAAERALLEAGVATVGHVDRCTSCEPEAFFSHRRDRGVTGRQGVIAYVA